MVKKLMYLGAAAFALTLAACGSSSSSGGTSFPRPTGTVAVGIQVDDRPNQTYVDGQLRWKGGWWVDPTTRIGAMDDSWSGKLGGKTPTDTTPFLGFPLLYDDGPWTSGGHEPAGAVAGDHIWGYAAFIPTTSAAQVFDYGMIDVTNADKTAGTGDAWVWVKPAGQTTNNTQFTVPANATADVDAIGMTFKKFGTVDVKIVLNKNTLDACKTWAASTVQIKGTLGGWTDFPVTCDTGGICTFTGSGILSTLQSKYHSGLPSSGDTVAWVWDFPTPTPTEYKCTADANTAGVTAFYKRTTDANYVAATIVAVDNGFGAKNTAIVIP